MSPFAAYLLSLTLLNASDTISTLHLIDRPGVYEKNPFVHPERPALFIAEVAAGTVLEVWLLRKLHRTHPKLAWVTASAIMGVEGWAVNHNVRLCMRLR